MIGPKIIIKPCGRQTLWMSRIQDEILHSNQNGELCTSQSDHSEKDMLNVSRWKALAELILILIPTGLLFTSGSKTGNLLK